MLQNLIAVRTCSLIFTILNLVLRILPFNLSRRALPALRISRNLTSPIGCTSLLPQCFSSAAIMLIVNYRKDRKAQTYHNLYVYGFSLYLIASGIFSSMIATSDPSNALTLYLVPLIIISIMFVFELHEIMVLIVAVALVFTSFLLYSQTNANELMYNELISIILLCGFYLTSRYFYSYKANYFRQLMEIREKNTEIENAGAFKNQVLGMVAHDLRNPLAAVESTAMIMELEEVNDDMRENIDIIKASCVKARSIISDLAGCRP